ncbi:Collectin-12 [Holothuria leucospilota]|uniref:Collectin-12 n=1 Tax=Holothuria leucospilota TaxID=206669 RepID=A0A9Q1BYM9_HOLLE|nr:Collectin-12 [Holothuria leucospilota]
MLITIQLCKTLCQNVGGNEGRWTRDNFTCDAWIPWRGHYYISCTTRMVWNVAASHCGSMSAHLVYINNADENSFVKSMLTNCNLNYASIGLLPIDSTQLALGWKWQDNIIASYTNWESSQLAHFEGCVGIASDGQWHDYACTTQYYCICEY